MPETNILEQNQNPQLNQPHLKHLRPSIWVMTLVVIAFSAGYLVWAKSNQSWPFDNEIIGLPTHQTTQNNNNSTADWKTYTNSQYGFEFKYPNDYEYKIFENSNDFPITLLGAVQQDGKGGSTLIGIKSLGNSYLQTVNEMSRQKTDLSKPLYVSDKEILFSGRQAQEFKYDTAMGSNFTEIIVNSSPVIIVHYRTQLGEINDKVYTNVINQILSTFKFIN